MANAKDVAAYVLGRSSPMRTYKLQKLLYFGQCWSLVWNDQPLFPEECRAWVHGPVVKEVYDLHRGLLSVTTIPQGEAENLSELERDLVDRVLAFYGQKDGEWLEELTHHEPPWRNARRGLHDDQNSSEPIKREDMVAHYGSFEIEHHQFPAALMRGLELLVNTPIDELDDLADPEQMVDFDIEGFSKWATTTALTSLAAAAPSSRSPVSEEIRTLHPARNGKRVPHEPSYQRDFHG